MRNVSKSFIKSIGVTAAIAVISIVLRTVLMSFGFDSTTLFYKNDIWATLLYGFVLISAVMIFIFTRGTTTHARTKGAVDMILKLIAAVISIGLLVSKAISPLPEPAIAKVTHYGALVSLVFAVIFYILDAFAKKRSSALVLLNVAPVVYLICQLIDCFTSISIKANSYYLFPDVVALLVLAFYVLYDGKTDTISATDKGISMYAYSLITFLFLAFSVVPDLFAPLNLNVTEVLLSALKIVYIVFAVLNIIRISNTKSEDK